MALSTLQFRMAREAIAETTPREVAATVNRFHATASDREWAHFCSLLEAAATEAKHLAPVYDDTVPA